MGYTDSDLGSAVIIEVKTSAGLALIGTSSGTPPTTANEFSPGAVFIDVENKKAYVNTGTAAVPVWNSMADVVTADIADAGITLAKLATGISPVRIAKVAATTAVYGGGGTSNAFVATGVLSTDVVTAVIRASTNAVAIAKATPTTDTLTVVFSADPGAGTTVDYVAMRAVA